MGSKGKTLGMLAFSGCRVEEEETITGDEDGAASKGGRKMAQVCCPWTKWRKCSKEESDKPPDNAADG